MGSIFRRNQPPGSVSIPLEGMVRCLYVVYFAPPATPPAIEALAEAAARWSDEHLEPPLRDAVAVFQKTRVLFSIELRAVQEIPALPVELLRYVGLGDLEERIVHNATHVVLVQAMDLNVQPRAGMWAALAAALGIRDFLQGVLFDPDALRIIDPDSATGWFSPAGSIAVAKHIIVPFSIGDRGLGWMTTRGLAKFGLPDVELRDVPPNLDKLSIFMNGVAQLLVENAMKTATERKGTVEPLELAPTITVDRAVAARALSNEDVAPAENQAADVAIRFDATNRATDLPMIRIERPPDFAGDTGIWLNHVAEQLIGSAHKVFMTRTSGDAMTRAHERAISELPQVKQRFAAGLNPGEVLFIKHGFPTSGGSEEYLWAAVNRWEGTTLTVQVANDPLDVPGLLVGMTVVLDEVDIFDWMLQLPGDRSEGGYTSEVALDEGHEAPAN